MQKVNLNNIEKLDFRSRESYKTLRTNLEFAGRSRKVFAVTSCTPNEGKTSVSFRLALSMAESGKRVVLVDDSIVRGTTSKRIVALLRQAGATEVHLRIAAPAIKYPCFYGVDMSTRAELASASLEPDVLAKVLGADSLRFLSVDDLKQACGCQGLCTACFDGSYVTPLYSNKI